MFILIWATFFTIFITAIIKGYLNSIGIFSALEMNSFLGVNVYIGSFLLFVISIWLFVFLERRNNERIENMKTNWAINPFLFWWVVLGYLFLIFVMVMLGYGYLVSLSFIFQSIIDFIKRIVELNK